jgi:hypothetical protein
MSATTNNFSLRKNNGPIKPEMLYMTFDCYHLNQARTRTLLSVLPGPGLALEPGRVETQAPADLYYRVGYSTALAEPCRNFH